MTLPNQDNDLDKRLHDLLYEQAKSYYFEGSSPEWFEKECPALIERFEQAFRDAGWAKFVDNNIVELEFKPVGNTMTGQEWYDRFKKETDDFGAIMDNWDDYDRMIDAAKRAAGLQND